MVAHLIIGLIVDHIGHGFARYSVTKDWSLPHFEKMYSSVSINADCQVVRSRSITTTLSGRISTVQESIAPFNGTRYC